MPSISTQPNRAYQNIPDVGEDSATQRAAIQTISDALKTHERRDSNYLKSFIRFEELVDLEIIDAQGNSLLDLSGGGSGGATELNDLTDVNITSLVDNRILGYDFASSMWTSQSAGDLNLSEIGHTHVLADITDFTGIDLGDLGDVDTVGASDFDLLFRTGAIWEPTDGLLQWSGSDLHIAAGDINFYAVGDAVQHSIRQNFPFSGDMTIQVVAGDLVLQPGDDVKLDADTNLQLEHGRQIRWLDNIDVPTPLLEFDSDAGGGLAVDIEMVSAIAEVTTASTSYVDLAGMVVDQNNLQTGDDYLIIVNANIRNFLSTAVNDNFVRIVNESETMFSGSEYRFESTSSNNVSGKRYGYVNWFTANAGVGDDDIQFQGQASAASPNLAVNGFRATLLNLTTLGSNHVKARDVSVTNIPASAAWTTVETVELTEPGDWIIFACVQCSGFNGNSDQRTRLHDGTNTITESTHDIEDSIGTKVHNFQGVIENAVGNETISLQMTNGGGGVTWNAVFKSIVAIRLDAFADYAVKRLADAPDPPDGNELTLDTLSFTAGETKGYVFFGALEEDWTASGASGGTELQVQVNGGGYTTISGGLTAEFEDLGSQDISQKLLHPNSAVFLSAGNSVDVRMRHDPAASPTNNDIFRTEIVAIALETAPTEQIFFVGRPDYRTAHLGLSHRFIDPVGGVGYLDLLLDGTDANLSASGITDLNITGLSGKVEVDTLVQATQMIAGDPGTEATGITVGGVTYESSLKVSDLGGTNIAQMILHRHSTTLPSLLIGARAKNDTSAHTIVANNDVLLTIIAAGWNGGDSYSSSSQINFEVDGTPGNDDMPGQITFLTTPDGTEVPVERMRIRATGNVEIDNDLIIAETAQINMGSLVGDKIILFSGDYKIGIEANAQYYTSNQLFRWYEDNADGGTSDAMELNAQSGNLTIGGSLIVGGLVDGVDVAAHAADATIHFTEASIDHTAILNIGTNTHAQIDTHIADATIHFTEASIDHTAILNIGTNTHAQIDTHIADATIHFTQAAISIPLSQISDVTATAAEVNLLDLAGLTAGWALLADSATTASWQALPAGGITQLTGDVTAGPGSGSQAATIPADTVTNAQLANMVNNTIKGRTTAGTGDPQDILLAANTVLGVFGGVLQGQQVQTLQIQDLAVTYAKMQNVSTGDRLLGRQSGGFGNVQEITLGTNLSLTGTTLNAAAGTVAFDDLTAKTSGTGNYQTSGDFIADNFEATGLGPLTTPGTDDAYVGGYGLMGDRVQAIYISNVSGPVQINASGVHGAAARVAEFGATTIEFDANLDIEGGHIFRVYDAADQDFIEIRHLGTSIEISAAGTGGGAEDIRISAGNSNAVILEYNTVDVFESQNHLLLGNTTGALVRHHDGSYYDVGMNVTPLAVEDNNLTLAAQHAGQYSYYDDGSNYNVATPASTDLDFPVGARFDMINRTGGVISITVGTGITLYWADGTGATFATGQRSLSYGWATLIRHTASVFIVTGNGLS